MVIIGIRNSEITPMLLTTGRRIHSFTSIGPPRIIIDRSSEIAIAI
jgi:hypothetical protein